MPLSAAFRDLGHGRAGSGGSVRAAGAQSTAPSVTLTVGGADVRFGVVETRGDFDTLEGAWDALFERAGRDIHLFQTFNWLWHWANHFLPGPGSEGPSLSIVTAHAGDRLIMVWPLVSERVGPLKQLSWMGSPVSQYGDVLLDDVPEAATVLEAGWDFVTGRLGADVLQLRKVRDDAVVAPLLAAHGARITEELKAPYLDLASAPTVAEYEKRYSSNARRNRGRQRRRLADRGPLELQWHTSGPEAALLTRSAFALKRAWLLGKGVVSPALTDPRTEQFFLDATRAETHPAGCHVIALVSNGQPAAVEIGMRAKGRSAIHVIAYDLALEKTGAGSLLMEDSIRRAKIDGISAFDMLAPGDSYKLEWADEATLVRDWAMPLSPIGRLYTVAYLGLIRGALKEGLHRLPLGVRQKLAGARSMLSR